MIDQVSDIQEDFRDLLRSALEAKDPILEEEALKGASKKYGEDAIVNMAMTIFVRFSKPASEPSLWHLMKAVAIMDDLDTFGMEVRFKQ